MTTKSNTGKRTDRIFTWRYILVLVCVGLVCIVLFNFILQISFVLGSSMEPTLKTGNLVLGNRLSQKYERMDIVTAKVDDQLLVKRIIALPGETVRIVDGYIYVNGEKIDDITDEPMSMKNVYYGVRELTLGEDEYFLVGDNRDDSTDSRTWGIGPVKEDQITAKVMILLLPPKGIR